MISFEWNRVIIQVLSYSVRRNVAADGAEDGDAGRFKKKNLQSNLTTDTFESSTNLACEQCYDTALIC